MPTLNTGETGQKAVCLCRALRSVLCSGKEVDVALLCQALAGSALHATTRAIRLRQEAWRKEYG